MFSFAVIRNKDKNKGTVVAGPSLLPDGSQHVVVMWLDFTFSTENIEDIQGDPVHAPVKMEAVPSNIAPFPGGGNDTSH